MNAAQSNGGRFAVRQHVSSSLMVLAVVCSTSWAKAESAAHISVEATYRDIVHAESGSSLVLDVPAEAHAYSAMDEWDYAESDGVALIGGSVGAYAGSQGAYGGPLHAIASASQTTEWRVASNGLPAGTPVRISLAVSFAGTIEATWYETASATASLTLGSNSLYEAGGTGGYHSTVGTGMWANDFVETTDKSTRGGSPRLESRRVYLLETTDILTFDTNVGQIVPLTLLLTAESSAAGAESGAWADFLHTGSYGFVGANDPGTGAPLDVQMQIVPEPATAVLAVLAAAACSSYRRRRPF